MYTSHMVLSDCLQLFNLTIFLIHSPNPAQIFQLRNHYDIQSLRGAQWLMQRQCVPFLVWYGSMAEPTLPGETGVLFGSTSLNRDLLT